MNRRDALKGAIGAAVAAAARPAFGLIWRGGSAATTSQHDLIVNIGGVTYYDPQQMFLNCFKQAGANANWSAWTTLDGSNADTNEEAYLYQILTNGYPTTLTLTTPPLGGQKFTHLKTGVFAGMSTSPGATSAYPAGTYRLQWQGKCTFTIGGDAVVPVQTAPSGVTISGNTVSSTNAVGTVNSITISVASTSSAGITFDLTAMTDVANTFQAASLVPSAWTSNYDSGQIFRPDFLELLTTLKPKVLRFMDFLYTNSQIQHSQYLGYMFSSAPTAGSPLPALAAAWPNQSGQRRITLTTGEELLATFTTGSTVVTSTTNPTITASSGTIGPGQVTTDFFWYQYDSFAARAQVADFSYATYKGSPYEIAILLGGAVGADVWLNVPPSYQSADWASLASLCVSTLASGQKAYIEFANEVWNGAFNAFHLLNCKSFLKWGSSQVASYYGMTVAQIADEFATTAGNPGFDNSFLVLMCGQAANTAVLTGELTAPAWTGNTPPWQRTSPSGQKTIKGVAIAPYFGNGPIYAADFAHMTSEGDGGYSDFFATLTSNPVGGYTYHDNSGNALPSGGWFAIASGYVTNTVSAIAPYGSPPIYCYEGSWQFDHLSESPSQETFLVTAARDSRMVSLQQQYYRATVAAGVAMPAQYNLCSAYGNYQWGLVESTMQPVSPLSSAPARYQGAVNYVQNG